jgi:hypothetical protein
MPKGIYVRSEQTLARLRERNRSPEMRAISSKQGLSNVINGHLAAIRPLAWAAPRSPEGLSVLIMNGKRQHARNVASGKTHVVQHEDCVKGGESQIYRLGHNGYQFTTIDRVAGGLIRGPIRGRINVESGLLANLRTPEHQRIAGRAGGLISGPIQGPRTAAAHMARLGLNSEESQVARQLNRLGIPFETGVNLGKGMGVPDFLVGDIIGELDGGAHNFRALGKLGISWLEVMTPYIEKDMRHDTARKTHGFLVIRDTDPVCLASRITDALKTTGAF